MRPPSGNNEALMKEIGGDDHEKVVRDRWLVNRPVMQEFWCKLVLQRDYARLHLIG
jgi:hypothetical protein